MLARRRLSTAAARIEWSRLTQSAAAAGSASAPPLLLINGFACGQDDWSAVPKIVGAKARRDVIAFDNRGIGLSEVPDGPYTVPQMAADALSVIDAVGADKVAVMGLSLGGCIAQELALSHPERVESLILVGTTHGGREAVPPPASFMEIVQRLALAEEPNAHPAIDDFMRALLPADSTVTPKDAKFLRQFKSNFVRTWRTPEGLQGQLAAMGRFNVTKRLGELRCPTLVVSGTLDTCVPPANAESLARKIDGATLYLHEGAGHFIWAHEALAVANVLARFLVSAAAPCPPVSPASDSRRASE